MKNKYFGNILNIISVIMLSLIFYRFISGLSFDIGLLSLIISFLISFAISNFVLDKFTYSENTYIRLIQRFLIYNFIFIMVIFTSFYVLYLFNLIPTIYCSGDEYFNIDPQKNKVKDVVVVTTTTEGVKDKEFYNLKMDKKLFDSGLENIGKTIKIATEKIAPNIGVGAATGAATAAAFKNTAGMLIAARLLVVGSTAAATAAGTKIGLDVGTAISKNIGIDEMITKSPHADPQHDRIPSPDPNIINSPLENDMTSPLQDLLLSSFVLDILILILLIGILILIFNRYIVKYNLNFINSIVNKFIPIKIRNWFNKNINTGIDYNNKLVLFIFIINTILLFLFVFLKLLISSTLLINIDSYINVHNYIHSKESSILLFMTTLYKHKFIHSPSKSEVYGNYNRYLSSNINKDLNSEKF
jgi:hypothetical protein